MGIGEGIFNGEVIDMRRIFVDMGVINILIHNIVGPLLATRVQGGHVPAAGAGGSLRGVVSR